jgi:hypothetical protein
MSNNYKSSPPSGATPLVSPYTMTSRKLSFGNSALMECTHAPRLTTGNLRGPFARAWTSWFGRFGLPPNARLSLGSLSKTESGLGIDLRAVGGPMVKFAPLSPPKWNGLPHTLQMSLLRPHLEFGRGLNWDCRLWPPLLACLRRCWRLVDLRRLCPWWSKEINCIPSYACHLGAMERAEC